MSITKCKRNHKIFEECAYVLIGVARKSRYRGDFEIDLEGNVDAIDSTTIDLCLSVFWRTEPLPTNIMVEPIFLLIFSLMPVE